MDNETIKRNILQVRESLNLTQEEFAGRLGISRQAYINLEHGKTSLISKQLPRMAEAFGVDPEVLILGTDPRDRRLRDIESERYESRISFLEKQLELMQAVMDEKDRALADNRNVNDFLIRELSKKND